VAEAGLPVSVVVPTIGRGPLLDRCVGSIMACEPPPREVILVDQSAGGEVARIAALHGAQALPCTARGIAIGTNLGLVHATYRQVMVTHDDCVVAPDWVKIGNALLRDHPGAILTGRVLPPAGSGYVPSTISATVPRDYTGQVTSGLLYPANMVLDRDAVLAVGGFDERPGLRLAAEDNDLCYRWLRSGRSLRYEPSLTVWHHDWRSPDQLRRTHIEYARGQGAFYAKHLRAGDRQILPLLWWDVRHGVAAVASGLAHRTPRWTDPYREMVGSLLLGILRNLPEADRLARASQRGVT
jgi:GT2 family glycosyltransferase